MLAWVLSMPLMLFKAQPLPIPSLRRDGNSEEQAAYPVDAVMRQ